MTIVPNFEPYRVKSVEPIRITTRQERRKFLKTAEYNLFRLPAEQVMIDLLTDSGTGAMSSAQWAGIMSGNEAYAGSSSFHRLAETIKRITGIANVLPVHQGRVAERLLVETVIGKGGAPGRGMLVPNNAHFDTTRAMIEASGAETVNLLCSGGDDPVNPAPFKGNMDPRKLDQLLTEHGQRVPFVMLTVTCNSNGGQPVSLENMRAVRAACKRFGKKLFLDACRFAENAWFIQQRELGAAEQASDRSVQAIVREMFDLCDGVAMSARKDCLCNTGGLLLLRDDELHRRACQLCVLTDGFQMTYGSLPGRDLEAIAVGMQEVMDETYLSGRSGAIEDLANALSAGGVAILQPPGGHALYLDAEDFCPHLNRVDSPAHALACAIYEFAGIRCTRIGSVMRNGHGEPMELVRLAIPRRTYTESHLRYVAGAICELRANSAQIKRINAESVGVLGRDEPEYQAA